MSIRQRTLEYDARATRRRLANADARQSYEQKYMAAALKPRPMRAHESPLWVSDIRFLAGIAAVMVGIAWWMFY